MSAKPPVNLAAGGTDPVPSADGRRRRRTALVLMIVALLAAGTGMLFGRLIQSPADRAAAQAPPKPSLITVPVVKQVLTSTLVLNGSVAYDAPGTITLGGPVGVDGDATQVVTKVPEVDADVPEGTPLFEVTGRPVFVLQGATPMYRKLALGSKGADVAELEAALARLGYQVGAVDDTYDDATNAGVEKFYRDRGYEPQGPTTEQKAEVTAAEQSLQSAKNALESARNALASANAPMKESDKLQLQRDLDQAKAAVPAAEAAVGTTTAQQDAAVASATLARDSAITIADAAKLLLNNAKSGALDPTTGEPYTPEQIAQFEIDFTTKLSDQREAQTALDSAITARTEAINAAVKAVSDAKYQLQLAQTQYNEGMKPASTVDQQSAVKAAENDVTLAQQRLDEARAAGGLKVPAGEMVFLPKMPVKVTAVNVALGGTPTGSLATVATSGTLVRARLSRADAANVKPDDSVEVEIRDAEQNFTGKVVSVGEPPAQPASTGEQGQAPAENDGRLEVVVAPDGGIDLSPFIDYSARVTVTISSTDGEQLVVPIAALSVGADGQDQVEVEREPATDTTDAVTENVEVKVGLSSEGQVAVTPVKSGALTEGDRVVIGVEAEQPVGATVAPGDSTPAAQASADTEAESSGESSSESSSDASEDSGSPLDQLFGFNDPVAQRAQQLQIEQNVSECMKQEGFEYKPVDYSALEGGNVAEAYGTPAFGEKYGYGVVLGYETLNSETSDPSGSFTDPNADYVAGLSEAERQTYETTLWGDTSAMSEGEDTATSAPPLEEQGCFGKAIKTVYGNLPIDDPEFGQMIDEFYNSTMKDPEATALVDKWKKCMAPAAEGFKSPLEVSSPETMYSYAEVGLAEAQGLTVEQVTSEADFQTKSAGGDVAGANWDASTNTGYVLKGTPKPLSAEDLERLSKAEVSLWKADQKCQEDSGLAEYQERKEQELADQLVAKYPELAND